MLWMLRKRTVSDALAEAEAKHEEALHNAEFLFEKRIAAKMVEMMEANAVKQAAAVEKAAEASKKKVRHHASVGHTTDCFAVTVDNVFAGMQAEIEFAIVANDLRTEMQKLVVTYDRALDEASVMQARAEQRAELYASDLAGHKAIDEKNQRLVISLRKDNAKLRLRQTLLFAKVVSLLSTERAAAKRSIELLTARSVHAESVAQDLMEVKKTLVLTMEANRIDAVTEVHCLFCFALHPLIKYRLLLHVCLVFHCSTSIDYKHCSQLLRRNTLFDPSYKQ